MQDSELFPEEVKEQGSWFFDLKKAQKAHCVLSSPSYFLLSRQSSGVLIQRREYIQILLSDH